MFAFIRRHWAASLALLLATLTAAAVITTCILFPPALAAVAAFTLFGATPLAFLSTMAVPAAVATVGAITFGLSLAASTLFNTVVSIYNKMDKAISPAPRRNDYSSLHSLELDEEQSHTKKGNSPKLMSKLLGCFSCCTTDSSSNKKRSNTEETRQTPNRMFPQPTTTSTQQRPLDQSSTMTMNPSQQ